MYLLLLIEGGFMIEDEKRGIRIMYDKSYNSEKVKRGKPSSNWIHFPNIYRQG